MNFYITGNAIYDKCNFSISKIVINQFKKKKPFWIKFEAATY